jgi:hypothetical protein
MTSERPDWLPRPAPRRRLPPRPWRPEPLTAAEAADESLRYVLVEEVVGDSIGLLVARWPRAGEDGLPVFADPEEDVEAGADRGALQRYVNAHRAPQPGPAEDELRRRPLALGDVFAARVDAQGLERAASVAVAEPGWLGAPLVDVTAEARQAARLIFYEAMTPPLSEAAEREIRDEQLGGA